MHCCVQRAPPRRDRDPPSALAPTRRRPPARPPPALALVLADALGYEFSKGAFARQLLLAGTLVAARVIRIEPPLTITQAELVGVVARLGDTLAAMAAAGLGQAPSAPALLAGVGATAERAAPHAPPHPALASLKEEGDEEDEDVPLAGSGRDRGVSLPIGGAADDETDCSSVSSSSTE